MKYYNEHTALPTPTASAKSEPLALQRPPSRPLNVLFAGDSITVGRDASSEATSFRGLITANLKTGGPAKPTRIGNSSLTVSQVLPEAQKLSDTYDILVVELGTNDVYKNDPVGFSKEYPAFLDTLRKTSPDGRLVCAGAWQANEVSAQLDDIISRECDARGGRFVTLRDIYSTPGNLSVPGQPSWDSGVTDGKHPSDKGHSAVAARILSMIAIS